MSSIRSVSAKRKARVQLRWNSTIAVQAKPTISRPKSPRKVVVPSKLKASTPIKRKGRKPSDTLRIYGTPARVGWVQSQPSVVSGKGPCENVHVKTGGTGRKADACWIVPLTHAEHRELHRRGQLTFEAKYGIDLAACAITTEAAWQERTRHGELPW